MTTRVRGAVAGDFEPVAALLAELGRPAADDADAHRAAWERYLAREDTVALVAVAEDGEVVGFLDMELRNRLNFLAPQAWIPDLIVTESRRSAGAGAALLAEAERIARERGCWGMTLESAAWRARAHAFYRREGWVDSGLSFTKSLDGRQWPPAPR